MRSLTGFNRVMAYRFHADDSGEIVAEAKLDMIDPYLGRRFPASDIPVQARTSTSSTRCDSSPTSATRSRHSMR